MTDGKILELFFERSQDAISEVRKKYGGKLFRLAQNLLGNRLDAEECVNDALFTAWNSIPPKRPDPLLPYLYTVVRHASMNRYRVSAAAKRNYGEMPDALDELEEMLSSPDTTETAFDRRELTRILNKFLTRLSKRDRTLFMGRYYAGESYSTMAQRLDTSENNCKVQLSRIRKKLKETLRKESDFPGYVYPCTAAAVEHDSCFVYSRRAAVRKQNAFLAGGSQYLACRADSCCSLVPASSITRFYFTTFTRKSLAFARLFRQTDPSP